MATIFFSSCKATEQYKEPSKKAKEYVEQKLGIQPFGCCRPNHKKLTADDTAIVVCNNCTNIIDENTAANIVSLWEIIDADDNFAFPDYHEEKMTIQDCWYAHDRPGVQNAVRSVLKKMNIVPVELKENFEATKFCGTSLLAPCSKSNATLAPKRYVEKFSYMFTPLPPEKHAEYFSRHCEQIETDKVACYCRACTNAINMGGKQAFHLLELLFPEEK